MTTIDDADQTSLRSRRVANLEQKTAPSSLSLASPSSAGLTARRLTDDDVDAFAHLTAADDAHGQGVAYRYIFPRRSDSLHFFFTSRLYVILRAGGVAVGLFERSDEDGSEILVAAACASPPGADPPLWLLVRAGLLRLPLIYGGCGVLSRLAAAGASDVSPRRYGKCFT